MSTGVEFGPVRSDDFGGLAESAEQSAGNCLRISTLSRLAGKVKTVVNRLGQSVVVNACCEYEDGA